MHSSWNSLSGAEGVLATSFGPHGLDHLLTDEANQPYLANSGDDILTVCSPEDAKDALLLRLVLGSCRAMGDGTKRVALMAMEGLRQYRASGLRPHTFNAELAAQVLQGAVPLVMTHVPLLPGHEQHVSQALHALVATHLCNKLGGGESSDHVATCVHELVLLRLQAAQGAGESVAEALGSLRDDPPLCRVARLPASSSRVLRGGLLLPQPPLPASAPLPAAPPGAASSTPASSAAPPSSREGTGKPPLPASAPLSAAPPGASSTLTSSTTPPSSTLTSSTTPPSSYPNGGDAGSSAVQQRRAPLLFLAVSCSLDGEALGCAGGGGRGGGGPGPPAVLVGAGEGPQGRQRVAAQAVELLRGRLQAAAGRGVRLLLCSTRPPDGAAALCGQLGITLVGGLDEQDLARAAAAGGTTPLASVTAAALAAAPLGVAAGARVLGLGPGGRRGTLLEFGEPGGGQPACWPSTLLLCAPNDAALRSAARSVTRCLTSLASAVGTMSLPRSSKGTSSSSGSSSTSREDGAGDEDGEEGEAECLVLVPGGAALEALLAGQLQELVGVARGVGAGEGGQGGTDGEAGGGGGGGGGEAREAMEGAAAEARELSELVSSLRLLHAMAAAVPRALAGGGAGSTAPERREATMLVKQLQALQQEQEQQQQQAEDSPAPLPGATCAAGLVVPAAALCSQGSLTALSGCAPTPPPPTHAEANPHPQPHMATGVSGECPTRGKDTDSVCSPGTPSRGEGKAAAAAAAERDGAEDAFARGLGAQLSYDCRFHAVRDVLSYGVVEAAAVAASCWGHAVSVLQQVIRIDGCVAAKSSTPARGGEGLSAAGDGRGFRPAGPAPATRPTARKGGDAGSRRGWGRGRGSVSFEDDDAGSSTSSGED